MTPVESVREYLKGWNLQDRLREFDVSSATVEEAAAAVGCEPARIAKTLSFLVDGGPVLVVMAGDARIDNPKYKAFFHQKASMIPADRVQPLTGFVVGGVCPFGAPKDVPVYLDESLRRFQVVYPAGGNPQSAVEVTPEELWQASRATAWIDIGRTA